MGTANSYPDAFRAAYDERPTDELCSRSITVDVVGTRCVYLNQHRIAGAKPYVSEGLSSRSMTLTVREALAAFSEREIEAYLREKRAREAYCAGLRSYRDALPADQVPA